VQAATHTAGRIYNTWILNRRASLHSWREQLSLVVPHVSRRRHLHEVVKVILRSILITRLGDGVFSMQIIISMIALPRQFFTLFGNPCFLFLLPNEATRLASSSSSTQQRHFDSSPFCAATPYLACGYYGGSLLSPCTGLGTSRRGFCSGG